MPSGMISLTIKSVYLDWSQQEHVVELFDERLKELGLNMLSQVGSDEGDGIHPSVRNNTHPILAPTS